MQQRGARMREIIFRGKRANNGKWVYGGYHKWETRQPCPVGNDELKSDEIKHVIVINSFADWNMPRAMQACEVIPETVGQYTGLTDKNGTKIFEGDIVKIYDCLGRCEGIGKIQGNELFLAWHTGKCNSMLENYIAIYEIIGNIHDNPELLEVAE